jgi:hypothetical protein
MFFGNLHLPGRIRVGNKYLFIRRRLNFILYKMRNTFPKWIAAVILLVLSSTANASLLEFGIEPIIGYERVQKLLPERHTRDRLFYGARVRLGVPLVSVEIEGTQGNDTEDFSSGLSIKETSYRLSLGARSALKLTSLLQLVGRAGGQARQIITEETLNGVTTKTVGQIFYRPYAGVGLISSLGGSFFLSGGITVVFNDFPNMSQNDYQTYLGFIVRLP